MTDITGPSRLRKWAARHEVEGLELFDLASEWEADEAEVKELHNEFWVAAYALQQGGYILFGNGLSDEVNFVLRDLAEAQRRIKEATRLIRILRDITINGTPLREQTNAWLVGDAAQADDDD